MASWALRACSLALPVAVAVVAGITTQRVLGPSATVAGFVASVLACAFVSALAAWFTDRLTRRLLPLAWLCRLTLVFPDQAPTRFAVALRALSVRRLREATLEAEPLLAPSRAKADGTATGVLALALALSAHDRRTRGHSDRVRALCSMLGDELHLDPTLQMQLCWAGLLHDIGKLEVPAAIINKAGALTEAERTAMRNHPLAGARIAAPVHDFLGPAADAIPQHHERWDGEGYPSSLRGEDIALAARIVTIADSFETMTATRAYKKPIGVAAARAEISRCAGSHFDPHLVRVFLGISLPRLYFAVGPVAILGQVPLLAQLLRIPPPTASAVLRHGAALVAAPAVVIGTSGGVTPPPAVAVAATTTSSPSVVLLSTSTTTTTDPPATTVPAPLGRAASTGPSVAGTQPPLDTLRRTTEAVLADAPTAVTGVVSTLVSVVEEAAPVTLPRIKTRIL